MVVEFTQCFSLIFGYTVTCYSNYFEVYVYHDLYFLSRTNIKNFSLIYNLTNSTNGKTNETFTFSPNKSAKSVTFAIRSRGACGKLYQMKLYYFYCEEIFINSVKFEKIISPANGFTPITTNCSANAISSKDNERPSALCSSNGTRIINDTIKCFCLPGFEPSQDYGCLACRNNYFKPTASNSRCGTCHQKSFTINNRTSCQCYESYYSLAPPPLECYTLPQMDQTPKTIILNRNVLSIIWHKTDTKHGLNEETVYDLECYVCDNHECSKNRSCVGERYDLRQRNINETVVVVTNLIDGLTYNIRIYAKNSLNNVVDKWKWSFKDIKISINGIRGTNEVGQDGASDFLTTILPLVISIAILLVVVLLLGFIWLKKRIKTNREPAAMVELENVHGDQRINEGYLNRQTNEVSEPSNITAVSNILSLFNNVSVADEHFWELPRKNLEIIKKLGGGNFGNVYIAKVKPIHAMASKKNGIVAVKMLKDNASPKDKSDFSTELNLMKKLEPHSHVVQLFGCCTQSEPYLLILEYLCCGDLLGYLRKSRGYEDAFNTGEVVPTSTFSENDLLSFAWMVADGMAYLSSKEIVHRDLAARNVLVGEYNICKVSDFGLSREGSYERKSKLVFWGFVMGNIHNWYSIMANCWNDDPTKRPTFQQLSLLFHQMVDKIDQGFLDLTKYEDHDYVNFDETK